MLYQYPIATWLCFHFPLTSWISSIFNFLNFKTCHLFTTLNLNVTKPPLTTSGFIENWMQLLVTKKRVHHREKVNIAKYLVWLPKSLQWCDVKIDTRCASTSQKPGHSISDLFSMGRFLSIFIHFQRNFKKKIWNGDIVIR